MIARADLLSRDAFREGVFQRDHNTCVVPGCGKKADDAHHIIERRLWTEPAEKEGYFLANGASLCEPHHQFGAELCNLQPQVLRQMARINGVVLPKSFDPAKSYDKWGVELKRPTRKRVKYPSTPYLPMSPGYDPNDINLPSVKPFLHIPLVITIKMDGSNACLSNDLVAARNGSNADHPSFDLLKARHAAGLGQMIRPHVQVFGEWLYAKHSIHYTDLSDYFQVIGLYNSEAEMFGSWEAVEAYADMIGCKTVPVVDKNVVFDNEWKLAAHLDQRAKRVIEEGHEGIVVRTMYPFPYGSFEPYMTTNGKTSWQVAAIAKYVRANHVATDDHWSQQPITRNAVRE